MSIAQSPVNKQVTANTKSPKKADRVAPSRSRLSRIHRVFGNRVVHAWLHAEGRVPKKTGGALSSVQLRKSPGDKDQIHRQEDENLQTFPARGEEDLMQTRIMPRPEDEMLQAQPLPTVEEVAPQSSRREEENLQMATMGEEEISASAKTGFINQGIQAKLTMSTPGDPYEREAEQVARQVVAGFGKHAAGGLVQKEAEEEVQTRPVSVYRRAEKQKRVVDDATEAEISRARSGGGPLSADVRQPMEEAFGRDFSAVHVHTDARSDRLNRKLQARAFTLGSDIFFRSDQYRPGTAAGKELLAHELTHVVQQTDPTALTPAREKTPVARKQQAPAISRVAGPELIQGGWFDWIKKKARKAAAWAKKKARQAKAWIKRKIQQAKNFVLENVQYLPGYVFVMNLIGKNPITNHKAGGDVGGALKSTLSFIGMQEMFNNLKEAKVFEKAWTRFKTAFKEEGLTGDFFANAFQKIASVLSVNPASWWKAVKLITKFLGSLLLRAVKVGKRVITRLPLLILEGFLVLIGAPVKKILAIFGKSGDVLALIAADPLKFAGHLVSAVKQGFTMFKDNIWSHLKTGLFTWLFGTLAAEGGLTMPAKFNLKGIFSLVTQLLGLTYSAIRTLLVGILGEKTVARLEKAWDFIQILVTQGLMGLWDWFKEKMGGLKDRVLEAARGWVISKLVTTGISKLLSVVAGPLGLIIEGVKLVYNIVMLFIEKANLFAALIGRIFDSVSTIAHGKIETAAKFIEKSLGLSIPVALSFLASILNLGNLGAGIKKAITGVREWFLGLLKKGAQYIAKKAKTWLGIGKKKGSDSRESLLSVPFKMMNHPHELTLRKHHGQFQIFMSSEVARLLLEQVHKLIQLIQDPGTINKEMYDGLTSISKRVVSIRALIENTQRPKQPISQGRYQRNMTLIRKEIVGLSEQIERWGKTYQMPDIIPNVLERKPASVTKLFQDENQKIDISPREKHYGDLLRQKLTGIADLLISGAKGNNIISAIRGNDESWTVSQGAIYAPFLEDQSEAVHQLSKELKGYQYLMSLERGGSFVAEQVSQGIEIEQTRIGKMKKVSQQRAKPWKEKKLISQKEFASLTTQKKAYKIQQKAQLQEKIHELMRNQPKDRLIKIVLTETYIGGGSLGNLKKNLEKILEDGKYPNLQFKILVLAQTMHKEGEGEGIVIREILPAGRIMIVTASTRFLLAEDVKYQLSRTAKSAKNPIIVFRGDPKNLIAYKIKPEGETTARDIIVDLVHGRYKDLLPGIL